MPKPRDGAASAPQLASIGIANLGRPSTFSDGRLALVLLSPALVLLLLVVGLPLLMTLEMSFSSTEMTNLASGGGTFIGLGNYLRLAADPGFWSALLRWGIFAVTTTTLELLLALTVAIYCDQVVRPPRWLEMLLVMPMFVIPVVSGLVFRYMLDPAGGAFAALFENFGLVMPSLLDDPGYAMAAIVLQDVWRMWPYVFLIVYAGLKSLPQEPIEAARLDGAGVVATTRLILLPMLRPTLIVALMLKLVESLKAFTEIYVMTGGGPAEATEIMSLFVVKQAFTFFRLSYGATASMVLLLFTLCLALGLYLLQTRQRRRQGGQA